MDVSSTRKEIVVTVTLSEREAKILGCLIGAMAPSEADEIVRRGIYFKEWIGSLDGGESMQFVREFYDSLVVLF